MSSNAPNNILTGYIGSYRITNVVGRGGFAVVYRAYQPFLERDVAIKVINTNLAANERVEQQFMAEARTIARLRHPNIVTVYEFGSTEQQHTPITYMVMEYLPGTTLDQILHQRILPVDQVLEIVEQLAAALSYAHANHIVHRDLKPANILFSDRDQPVIVDFGLATLLEVSAGSAGKGDDILTSSTTGTPSYMAPEQVLGLRGSPASDQYALALIVYEMLAQRRPFTGEEVGDIFAAKLAGPFRPLTTVAPQYPPAVDAVLSRALSVDPNARYADALDFSRALSEALLPDRQVNRTANTSDPVQAAHLRSARQTVLGFMWGLMLLTFVVASFCLSLFVRGYLNADGAFIWDGIVASTSIHDGWRDVIALWPASPAAKAGVQAGDRIKTDIYLDTTEQDGDFTVNGRPRVAYPAHWVPQPHDVIMRDVLRNGTPLTVYYELERSPLNLLILLIQMPAAILAFFCAAYLLRQWAAEPGIQIFTMVLMATSFALVASGVTNEIANLDGIAVFILLPLLLHLILLFPQPLRYFEQHPRRLWLIYLPFPIALTEFLLGSWGFDRFNVIIYLAYALLIIAAIWFKWARQDLKRYPSLRLLLVVWCIASVTIFLGESLAAFDDYTIVKALWGGNGLVLLAVDYGLITLGSTISVLFGTLGIHRVQKVIGRTVSSPSAQFPSARDLPDIGHTIILDQSQSAASALQSESTSTRSALHIPTIDSNIDVPRTQVVKEKTPQAL